MKDIDLKALFKGKKVVIAGDIMLDSYIFGSVERISPEAPVPVVAIQNRDNRPGGAANVAVNIKSLGAEPLLCSVIGDDDEGIMMKKILEERGLCTKFIFKSKKRKTTAKIRVMAQKNQMLRLDYENTDDLDKDENKTFLELFGEAIKDADVLILEDYNKGLLTKNNISKLISAAKGNGVPITVDPKRENFWEYKEVDIFKPNLKELKDALNLINNLDSENEILEAVDKLETKLKNKVSFITLSERGVFIRDKKEYHFLPAFLRRIADVSGAGDTVISVASLCLAAGMKIRDIAYISNLAGGLVCEEPGVVSIELEKLQSELKKLGLNNGAL